jgi:20S proteasome subunit beta 1
MQNMYVGNSCSDKLEPIHQRIYAQRSGTSSHTRMVAQNVRMYVDIQANELGNFPPVESAASIMREIIYSNRNFLSASMICSGWDPYKGYQIYQVNSTGFKRTGDFAVSGSGSVFIMGFMDSNYNPNMSKAEIKEFLKSCISLACYRDGSSGGCCRLLDITEEKIEREFHEYGSFLIK